MILGKMLLPPAGTTLTTGLLRCWEFNEASGSMIPNAAAPGGTLACSGTYTPNVAGRIATAYAFAGAYAYNSNVAVTAFPFTISWWLNPAASSVNRISTNVSGVNYYGVEVGLDAGQCIVQFGNGGGSGSANRKSYVLTGAVSTGVWHHVAVVVNSHGSFTYYLDNVVKSGFVASGTAASTSFAAGGPYVGKMWGAGTTRASCTCDQVAFWNKALSAAEVALLYNSGNGLAYSGW